MTGEGKTDSPSRHVARWARNDIIFSFQGNRNPFVDHPEWAYELFGHLAFFEGDDEVEWPRVILPIDGVAPKNGMTSQAASASLQVSLSVNVQSEEATVRSHGENAIEMTGWTLRVALPRRATLTKPTKTQAGALIAGKRDRDHE